MNLYLNGKQKSILYNALAKWSLAKRELEPQTARRLAELAMKFDTSNRIVSLRGRKETGTVLTILSAIVLSLEDVTIPEYKRRMEKDSEKYAAYLEKAEEKATLVKKLIKVIGTKLSHKV